MDGKTLLMQLRNRLNEDENSTFLDTKSSYEFLNEAAIEFASRTKLLTSSQTITTVANQAEYSLNADFLNMYLKDSKFDLFVKYNDGTVNSFPTFVNYQTVAQKQVIASALRPERFYLKSPNTTPAQINGTATNTVALSGGESTLNDTGGDFSNASPGDCIHNTTDGSSGVITSITSVTSIKTALFGGTNNFWTAGDAFVIQPQTKFVIGFDDIPTTAGHTVTVEYVKRPDPVYTDYASFRFPWQYTNVLVMYAMYLYKIRDNKPREASQFLILFNSAVKKASSQVSDTTNRRRLNISFKKRRT